MEFGKSKFGQKMLPPLDDVLEVANLAASALDDLINRRIDREEAEIYLKEVRQTLAFYEGEE